LDELPAGTHVMLCDPERIRTRAADLVRTSEEFLDASWAAAAGGGKAPVDLGAASLRTIAEVRSHALELGTPWWSVSPFVADEELDARPEPGVVHVSTGCLLTGFTAESLRLVVLTETDLAGQRTTTKDMRRLPSKRRNVVDPLQLKPGDYVVHEQHGVGKYVD